ncbi:hypothetical protein [Actinomadura macrotermitis]|uniref:hypothetical protein n=1 Tax=Actinomadura macrotermitis TaxID=2585200 RepID=UPI001F21122F|nr:hypothetical protein [Actinomadura macrotermitis]
MIEARDTDAAPAASGGRQDRPGRKGPGPKVLIGGAAALVVALAVVAGVVLLGGGGEKKKPAGPANGAQISPVAYTPDYDGEGMAKLARRDADARPFTADEVFGADAKALKGGGYAYTLAASDVASDCKSVTWGARLQEDLAKHGCSQIARGSYVSQDKRYVGQFIAINMQDQDGVRQILRVLDPATSSGFVLPLAAPGAPAFTKGFSAAYAKTFGHYAVVSWVQRAGGADPANLTEAINASIPIEGPADFVWARLQMVSGK